MLGTRGALCLAAAALLLGAACSSSKDRPGTIAQCPQCAGGTGGIAAGGSAGAATCEPDLTKGKTVQGDVSVFTDDTFDTLAPYAGTAELSIPGEPCGFARTTYTPGAGAAGAAGAGQDLFTLSGARVAVSIHPNWLRMRQIDGPDTLLPTILPVYTANDVTAKGYFAFVKPGTIDTIAGAVGMTQDPTKAQLVVQLSGAAPGVKVFIPGAEAIIYASNGTWVGNGQGTDATGFVLGLNVTADTAEAGTAVDVTTSSNGTVFTVTVIAGYVTWFQAALGF